MMNVVQSVKWLAYNGMAWRSNALVSICPPEIPHDLSLAWTLGRHGRKSATNRLNHGTAKLNITWNIKASALKNGEL
jgi:hypothetical protein